METIWTFSKTSVCDTKLEIKLSCHDNEKNMMALPVENFQQFYYTILKVHSLLYITYHHQNVEKLAVSVCDIYGGQNWFLVIKSRI